MAMGSYAFWNNKGGVGKSFLCFVAATEYANNHPETDVYVIDLCPQANVSEILLPSPYNLREQAGADMDDKAINSASPIHKLIRQNPRSTIAGYVEARLNSPFRMIQNVLPYVSRPCDFNINLPENLLLVCGDNLLEILSEAIRQTSQLMIPVDSWAQVLNWVRDLTNALSKVSGIRDTLFFIDCNPSFAIYTQLALVAAENVVVPFTADDSSRRAIENVIALLYGYTTDDPKLETYARISFAQKARDEDVNAPKLHTFVSNRVTMYEGSPSRAFEAMSETIKDTVDTIHKKHRVIYANPKDRPSKSFITIPDYHSASVYITTQGMPLYKVKSGPKNIHHKKTQLNQEPLDRYKQALTEFVNHL